jgi:hypothetical protein
MTRARSADIAVLPGRDLAQQAVGVPLRIVEHAAARPFDVGNARRQQAFGAATPRGSKAARADFLIIHSWPREARLVAEEAVIRARLVDMPTPVHLNSLSNPFASFRSAVSKPSVNQS